MKANSIRKIAKKASENCEFKGKALSLLCFFRVAKKKEGINGRQMRVSVRVAYLWLSS
jgi:hypothetical protein